jgi:anti-repressor protein
MNDMQIFNNPEFGKVRTIVKNNEPWFVGKDVADALGYKETAKAIRERVDDDDKGVSILDTPGGKQKMTIINESGLYSLILSSKLPTAKKFKHWVTSEVLPDIRKHGLYAKQSIIDMMINDPDSCIALLTKYKEEKQEKERLQAELDYSKEWYSIKRVAKLNDISWKSISWRKLKQASADIGIGVKKIFDANYGEVNTYHVKAWEVAYPELEL